MTRSRASARKGARRPQLKLAPDYVSSSGPEAIELAEQAGLILDDWQADIVTDGLGELPDGNWAAREVGEVVPRQNGKGSTFEVRELAGLILFGEQLIIHTAHEVKTAMEAFRRITDLFTNNDDLRRRVKKVNNQNGEEGIELLTGQRLRFLARSKGAGRGFSCECLIWDEAYALTDGHVDAQMPTLSAKPNHQIWYGSSPPLNSVDGAVLMRLRKRALAAAKAGVTGPLVYYDWGRTDLDLTTLKELVKEKKFDLDDVAHAYAANPAMPDRISEATVRAEREAMSDEGYARERLCIWPKDLSSDFQIISEDDWEARRDRSSKIAGAVCLSFAVSLDRSRATICAAGYRADGDAHVEITANQRVIDTRMGVGWVVPRLVEIVGNRKRRGLPAPCAIVVDAGGPQGSLIAECEKAGLEIQRIGTADVARGYGMFHDGVCDEDAEKRDLWHIGQPELTASVAGATTRLMGPGATTWDAKAVDVDITPVRAATDALFGLKTFGHLDTGPVEIEGSLMAGAREVDHVGA